MCLAVTVVLLVVVSVSAPAAVLRVVASSAWHLLMALVRDLMDAAGVYVSALARVQLGQVDPLQ
jgi:hypothetical protein